MDTNEMLKYLEQKTQEQKLLKQVFTKLDETSIRCLKQALPHEQYSVWLQQNNFGLFDVESAIAASAGRTIVGGVEGVIKYVSRILWNRRKEARSSRGQVASFSRQNDVERDDDAF